MRPVFIVGHTAFPAEKQVESEKGETKEPFLTVAWACFEEDMLRKRERERERPICSALLVALHTTKC